MPPYFLIVVVAQRVALLFRSATPNGPPWCSCRTSMVAASVSTPCCTPTCTFARFHAKPGIFKAAMKAL
eukprot:6413013-Prorocentrum_lima.AAC.1